MSFAIRFAARALIFTVLALAVLSIGLPLIFSIGFAIELGVLWATGFWSDWFPTGLLVLLAFAFGISKALEERP